MSITTSFCEAVVVVRDVHVDRLTHEALVGGLLFRVCHSHHLYHLTLVVSAGCMAGDQWRRQNTTVQHGRRRRQTN